MEDEEETLGPDQTGPTVGAAKPKGESHQTSNFTDKEDKLLCICWLAASQDCINGAQQKGSAYWRKVVQEYHERKLHKPFGIVSNRGEESIKKRWKYIKQETHKFCAAIEHAVNHPESGTGVVAIVSAHDLPLRPFSARFIISKPLTLCVYRCPGPWPFSEPRKKRDSTWCIVGRS